MDRDSITRTGARAPGVERLIRSHGGAHQRIIPDPEQGITDVSQEHEGRRQTSLLGRPRLTVRPWSRTGENPPYGILGEAMETSASFEARSAPLPYPTTGMEVCLSPPKQLLFPRLVSQRHQSSSYPSADLGDSVHARMGRRRHHTGIAALKPEVVVFPLLLVGFTEQLGCKPDVVSEDNNLVIFGKSYDPVAYLMNVPVIHARYRIIKHDRRRCRHARHLLHPDPAAAAIHHVRSHLPLQRFIAPIAFL